MKKTTVDGKTVNQRTANMLALWQFNALTDFYVVQGSYNNGVGASGGTHDGGGALDLSVYGFEYKFSRWVVKQGRLVGFAAWYREAIPRLWGAHIHAIALGDADASQQARDQMDDYTAKPPRDGLAGNGPDPGPVLKKIRRWPVKTSRSVNLLTAQRQFKKKTPNARMTVKRIQWVLNEQLGTKLIVDGVAGPQTRNAYAQWETRTGSPNPDGVPGKVSLKALGEGRFTVDILSWEKWREDKSRKASQKLAESVNPTFLSN